MLGISGAELLERGFRKVEQSGWTYITAHFYNPQTGETMYGCVRDYDYEDCRNDNDDLYYMPIDAEARRAYLHSIGIILDGDTVEVVKGRKVPVGTVGKVTKKYEVNDKYGRWVADYVVINGEFRTNVTNCVRVA